MRTSHRRTISDGDFLTLAGDSVVHAGLIVLRSQGLARDAQWAWLEPVVRHVLETGLDLTNQLVEVNGPGKFSIRPLPET
ncbi:MAG: hypothetical protein RL199_348 [Pseudomonadota bacterium]|jgi:hypothetical protein